MNIEEDFSFLPIIIRFKGKWEGNHLGTRYPFFLIKYTVVVHLFSVLSLSNNIQPNDVEILI